MIFVDTGAWYASLVPTDPDHTIAVQWLASNRSPLITTDYVVDETLTLLRARGEKKRALVLGARFFNHAVAEIHKITAADLVLAWKIFEQFEDKNWSFTDCTSKVVMERLNIRVALLEWRLPSTNTSTNSVQFKSCRDNKRG
jgi:predicted nucleic acid-binding protein